MRSPRIMAVAAIFAAPSLAVAGGPLFTHGLPHVPLGEGEIAIDPDGHLVISHIGPTGKDGARVDLGGTAGGWYGAGALLDGEPPNGASIVINDIGTLDGTGGWPLGGMQIRWRGGAITVGPHLAGLVPQEYTLNMYLAGTLVYSRDAIAWTETFASVATGQTTRATYSVAVQPSPRNVILALATEVPVTVDVPGDSVVADRMEFVPDGETPGIEAMNAVALCLASTGDVVVDFEKLRALGHWSVADGDTRMAGEEGALALTNLGPGGRDEVTLEMPGVAGADVAIVPEDFGVVDDRLAIVGRGRFGDSTADLGRAEVYNPGGLYLVDADFGAVSSANAVRLQVVAGGEVVATAVIDGAAPLSAVISDAGAGHGHLVSAAMRPARGDDPPGYAFRFDRTVRFDPFGDPEPADGDEIRLLVDDPDDTIGPLETLRLETTGLGTLTIVALTPEAACPWDLDGDGEVGFVDLVSLLSQWGPCDGNCPADFDDSDDVGFQDAIDLLAHWGNC